MTFNHWLKSRLLPASSYRGHWARHIFHLLTPWRIHQQTQHLLQALAGSKQAVFFVQVGSNDAGYGDPLAFFTRHYGWRGLMIEPLPHIFARLRQRYARFKGLKFANVAIANEPGERPFYHLRRSDEAGLPPWYDMLGSFDRANVLKHQQYLADIPERIVETQVRCARFDTLCQEHGINQFDVLHIDAEGYDFEVLKTVDLARYKPAVILFEHTHLLVADLAAAQTMLRKAGYLAHSDPADLLAVATTALEQYPRVASTWRKMQKRPKAALPGNL